MAEPHEELLGVANKLDELAQQADRPEIKDALARLQRAAEDAGKAWSGSWLGYHANVYYENLTSPPPGHHFSQEWGLMDRFVADTCGTWVEYQAGGLEDEIRRRADYPDMQPADAIREQVIRKFDSLKAQVSSILETATGPSPDKFLSRLADELDGLSIADKSQIIQALKPRGKFVVRDTTALGQGLCTPPHISVLSEVLAVRHALVAASSLAALARKAGSHLSRRHRQRQRVATVGTNVFVGHGRSSLWRELKDFLEDRLQLPVDEFNRVPVAGVTNIARLSEMMDAAALALLVMTGEDEQPDGKVRARMNVVHEAGLFQGRLGFSRAIVLLEQGCEEFSNIEGLGQIRFPKGQIKAAFEEIREVCEREGLLRLADQTDVAAFPNDD